MGRRAKIKTIGRPQAKVIREIVEKAAADALKSSGLEVKIDGTVRYDSATCTVKVQAFLPEQMTARGEGDSQLLGFSDNIIGETFDSRGTTFTIKEIHLRKPKYPIIAVNDRGTRYKFPAEQVARTLDNKSITFSRF